jgi:nitric oxide reductase activation protein
MSGSTGESIGPSADSSQFSDDMQPTERSQRRIIDVEKEAITLLMDALEAIGDRYGVYGFSGHGRDHVEFYTIKGLSESFNAEVAKRLGRIGPLHATRMGPAIRHTTSKLREEQAGSKFLFLISDGRPQDRGYSQESAEKAYALHDTRMSLIEARREGVHPFCLTIDKEGNDYLRTMMNDFSYEVLADVSLLPQRLPQLYRKLTT